MPGRSLWFLLALLSWHPAMARRALPANAPSPIAECVAAANVAGVRQNIPDGLMARIALAESGRPMPPDGTYRPWPWSINADGADLVFDTEAEAVAWVRGPLGRAAKLIDAGCLQVNLQYHPHAFATVEEAFDPWTNAAYAATYLRQLYDDESGHDWSVAVGLYHSHTPELAAEYRERVASLGQGIIQGLPPGPIAARLAAIGVIRVPLANGHVLRLILNRQPTMPGYHRPSRCKVARTLAPEMATPPDLSACPR